MSRLNNVAILFSLRKDKKYPEKDRYNTLQQEQVLW